MFPPPYPPLFLLSSPLPPSSPPASTPNTSTYGRTHYLPIFFSVKSTGTRDNFSGWNQRKHVSASYQIRLEFWCYFVQRFPFIWKTAESLFVHVQQDKYYNLLIENIIKYNEISITRLEESAFLIH